MRFDTPLCPDYCWESEASDTELKLNLLLMPSLVIDRIISLLSPSDILSLRLTCSTTSSWVESIFKFKLPIKISNKQSIATLIRPQHPTPWSNFTFDCSLAGNLSQRLVTEFSTLYGDQITTLKFTANVWDCSTIRLIIGCTHLKTLFVECFDTNVLIRMGKKDKIRFSNSLSKLEHLGVIELLCDDRQGPEFFIQNILSYCSLTLKSISLPFLTFPAISSYPIKYALDKTTLVPTTPTDVLIVRPLICILEENSPALETIVVVPESRKELSDSALFCLTIMCYQKKVNLVYDKLCYSHFYSLGKLKYAQSKEPTMSEIASKIMTVMASTTDLILNYEFANLRKLVVQFKTFHIEQDIFVVQNFPRLDTLIMDFKIRHHSQSDNYKFQRMDMFVQGILDVARPSVKRLKIQNATFVEPHIKIPVGKITQCFINLKCLSLSGFGGVPKDFQILWENLRLLEVVDVDNCEGLNDKGILGEDWIKPSLLKLTDLRELSLKRTGRITDLSYIIAFSHLRLTKFHHQPIYKSDVTREGYRSLCEGDFSKSIKFLSGTTTYFGSCKKSDLKDFLSCFKSLIEPQQKQIFKKFTCRKSGCLFQLGL